MDSYVVYQEDEKDCGAASLLSIIKYYKGFVPMEIIKYDTLTSSNGTTFYNIKMAAIKYGFRVIGSRELEDFPCIAQVKINNYFHFVVVYSHLDNILVMDPARGMVKYSKEEFNKIFTGNTLLLKPIKSICKYQKNNYFINYIKSVFSSHKKILYLVLIITILIGLFNAFLSYLIKYINYTFIPLIYAFIVILNILLYYYKDKINIRLNNIITSSLMTNYISKYFNLPFKYLYLKSSGDILNRINDLRYLKENILNIFIENLIGFLSILVCFLLIFFIDKEFLIIFILIIILTIITVYFFNKKIFEKYYYNVEIETDYKSLLTEYITNISTINILNRNSFFNNKLINKQNLMLNSNRDLANILSKLSLVVNISNSLVLLFIIFFGKDAIILFVLFNSISSYLVSLYYFIPNIKFIKNMIDRVCSIYYLPNKSDNISNYLGLDIINLSYSINKTIIFDKFNMHIRNGEKVLLMGPNGSGKSTLLNIINGSIDNYEGLVKVNSSISYAYQNMALFNGTVKENIILDNDYDEEKYILINRLTKNYLDSTFYINDNISGGEKQKIIIARTLYFDSKIILFDESFSDISIKDREEIIDNINNYYKDKTIIYVNHFISNNKYTKKIKLDIRKEKDVRR